VNLKWSKWRNRRQRNNLDNFRDKNSGGKNRSRLRGDPVMNEYAAEVIRWNTQFSLISRSSPEKQIWQLIEDSHHALGALLEVADSVPSRFGEALGVANGDSSGERAPRLIYIDIGSGVGVPGIVWHHQLRQLGNTLRQPGRNSPCTYLVEPRQKRAWFLEHSSRTIGLEGIKVIGGRWGGISASLPNMAGTAPTTTYCLISVRALNLSEEEIVAGWKTFAGSANVNVAGGLIICRFMPEPEIREHGRCSSGVISGTREIKVHRERIPFGPPNAGRGDLAVSCIWGVD